MVVVDALTYQHRSNQPQFSGTTTTYIVVTARNKLLAEEWLCADGMKGIFPGWRNGITMKFESTVEP